MFGREVNIIFVILVIISVSCSSLRTTETTDGDNYYMVRSEKFFREVSGGNLISGPLSISRIIIKYRNGGQSRRLRANLKYDGQGKMLISIRTFAGIEAARILAEGDSVKINDRINKIYYRGTSGELEAKYGFNPVDMGLLLGDIGEIKVPGGKLACINGKLKIVDVKREARVEYTVDCNNRKLSKVRAVMAGGKGTIIGVFKDFVSESGLKYPAELKWSIQEKDTEIEMEIDNVRRQEDMNFIFERESGYIIKGFL